MLLEIKSSLEKVFESEFGMSLENLEGPEGRVRGKSLGVGNNLPDWLVQVDKIGLRYNKAPYKYFDQRRWLVWPTAEDYAVETANMEYLIKIKSLVTDSYINTYDGRYVLMRQFYRAKDNEFKLWDELSQVVELTKADAPEPYAVRWMGRGIEDSIGRKTLTISPIKVYTI